MAYVRNRFTDHLTGATYDWPVNHTSEENFGKERSVERGAPTSNLGLIRQQGDATPLTLQLSGIIFHAAHHAAMWVWFQKCESRTIEFRDFTGDTYEVLITSFTPMRRPTMSNPRDPTIPLHYWSYTITMDVILVRSGALAGVTP